jgi:hypothetical protein
MLVDMSPGMLSRFVRWVESHGVDCNMNAEDGYLVIHGEAVHADGTVTRETDRARTVADARAILGY